MCAPPADFDPSATHVFSYEPVFELGVGRRFFFVLNSKVPVPSQELTNLIGGSSFLPVAFEFLGFAYNFVGLRPEHSILDAGCGIGRMAFGMAPFLRGEARYEGFDIDPRMIDWARRNITASYPQFRFQVADVFNSYYNPRGNRTAADYRFPYEDGTFDSAVLMSVFTHMDDRGVDNYLNELARVLKPGARCMITAFLLDDVARSNMERGATDRQFNVPYGKFWSVEQDRPENAVGIDLPVFVEKVRSSGFRIERIFPGHWSGRLDTLTLQDLLILVR